MIIRSKSNIYNELAEVIMSKRVSPQATNLTLSSQLRQALIGILTRHVSLDIAGRELDDETLWDILLYASVNGITIERACNELDAVPPGNTVRDHVREALDPSGFGVCALEDQFQAALQDQLPSSVLRRRKRKGWEGGIDLTELPYHGKSAQTPEEISRGKAKSGTTHFHSYATLAIVHNNQRYEVALTFVWADESMDQVIDRLLDQVRHLGLRLRRVYLDKGFCRREVFTLLRRRRLPYLIPIPVKGKSGGIRQLFTGRKSYRATYTFNVGKDSAYTTEVIVILRYSKGRYGRHGSEWFVYAAYGMDRVPLPQIFNLYRRRFGMESGYRQLHQIRARTTSPNPTWRLLLVGLGFLLYNVYIFFRQWGQTTRTYGLRRRQLRLSLGHMKRMIQRFLEKKFGSVELDPLPGVG